MDERRKALFTGHTALEGATPCRKACRNRETNRVAYVQTLCRIPDYAESSWLKVG